MQVWIDLKLRLEQDILPWPDNLRGDAQGETEVFCFDLQMAIFGNKVSLLHKETRGGGAVGVIHHKRFGLYPAGVVKHIGAWERDSVQKRSFWHVGVEQAEASNDLTIRVTQQGIGNAVGRGKAVKNLGRIITDRGDIEPLGLAQSQAFLQLDELRTAERSPVGTAVKHQDQPMRT